MIGVVVGVAGSGRAGTAAFDGGDPIIDGRADDVPPQQGAAVVFRDFLIAVEQVSRCRGPYLLGNPPTQTVVVVEDGCRRRRSNLCAQQVVLGIVGVDMPALGREPGGEIA